MDTPLPPELVLRITPDGQVVGLHSDALVADIAGRATITRATLIEPHPDGGWGVWDARTGLAGAALYRAETRAACLAWERDWVHATLVAPPVGEPDPRPVS